MKSRGACWKMMVGAVLCLLMPAITFAQDADTGSVAHLEQARGFKYLKLGVVTKFIPAYKMTYRDGDDTPDADSCYRYIYQDDDIVDVADGLKLEKVGVRTYNKEIVEVYLFFKQEDGYKLLKNFTDKYGTCSERPADFTYIWNTGDVNLTLRYTAGLDLGVAIFSSNKLEELVKQNSMKAAAQKVVASSVSIAGN
jgi:hypothetical protein